jgi:hypothetical protein
MEKEWIISTLQSGSDALADLVEDIDMLIEFLAFIQKLDTLPNMEGQFYEENRSLYQVVSKGRTLTAMETYLGEYFGDPEKAAGKPLPLTLRFSPSAKYLGGIQKPQALFLRKVDLGEFYGALWPWQRKKNVMTVHVGFCSDKITDKDYACLEKLVKQALSERISQELKSSMEGRVRGISLPSFLQMSEMEGTTCTLKVLNQSVEGFLYLSEGRLIHALTGKLSGREAAYEIISWENVEIEILKGSETTEDEINQPLMNVLMESLKVKDERDAARGAEAPPDLMEAVLQQGEGPGAAPPEPETDIDGSAIEMLDERPDVFAEDDSGRPRHPGLGAGQVPTKPLRHPKRKWMVVAIVALVVIIGVATALVLRSRSQTHAARYQQVLEQFEEQVEPKAQQQLLQEFIASDPGNPHVADAQDKLAELEVLIEEFDYETVSRNISNLPVDHLFFGKARRLYQEFIEAYPESPRAAELEQMIVEVGQLIDDTTYNALRRMGQSSFAEQHAAMQSYLTNHPDGKHRTEVAEMIVKLSETAYQDLKQKVPSCDKSRDWGRCLRQSELYLATFKESRHLAAVKRLKQQMVDRQDWAALRQTARKKGTDFGAVKQLYSEYLKQHPQTSMKADIRRAIADIDRDLKKGDGWDRVAAYCRDQSRDLAKRMQKLKTFIQQNPDGIFRYEAEDMLRQLNAEQASLQQQRQRQAKQQQTAAAQQAAAQAQQQRQGLIEAERRRMVAQLKKVQGRYRSNNDGTVLDQSTGLSWTTLDSLQELGYCIDYAGAQRYVQQLNRGRKTDWRLPTAGELAAIYKNKPFFPASGAKWYWSSESFAKGYKTVVNVVTAKPETVFIKRQVEMEECGVVRAIRP